MIAYDLKLIHNTIYLKQKSILNFEPYMFLSLSVPLHTNFRRSPESDIPRSFYRLVRPYGKATKSAPINAEYVEVGFPYDVQILEITKCGNFFEINK